MPSAEWTTRALLDAEEIAFYIAVEDGRPAIAEQILRELRDKAELFAQQPELGELRPDLDADLRCRPHKRWLLFYEPSDTGITVHRVIDGSRDYPRLFGGRSET